MKKILVLGATGRILWVTGMGIHHEVPGEVGKILDELCRKMSEYVQAVDRIAVARFMVDLVENGSGLNKSLGVTN